MTLDYRPTEVLRLPMPLIGISYLHHLCGSKVILAQRVLVIIEHKGFLRSHINIGALNMGVLSHLD